MVITLATNQVFAVGTYPYGPFTIPAGISAVQLDVATTATGAGVKLLITFERFDGASWAVIHRMDMEGGITPRGPNAGKPANLQASMLLDVVPGQEFRVNLTISGAPITLSATATTS